MPRISRWEPIYARSLGVTLGALFVTSFVIHWTQSARIAAKDALAHGEKPLGTFAHLGDAQLWFESFQN